MIETIDIKEKDSKQKYNDIAYENISDTFYLVNFCLLPSFFLLSCFYYLRILFYI